MTRNRGEQVIEIMRNTACQLTDRLHLLTLHELRFERLELRRVGQHGEQPRTPVFHDPRECDLKKDLLVATARP